MGRPDILQYLPHLFESEDCIIATDVHEIGQYYYICGRFTLIRFHKVDYIPKNAAETLQHYIFVVSKNEGVVIENDIV